MQFSQPLLTVAILSVFMFKGFADSSKKVNLPLPNKKGTVSLEEALNQRQSQRGYKVSALELSEVSQVIWAAGGKNKWGKLTVPSAGALYPLTIYLVAGKVNDLENGLYRYNPQDHSLTFVSSGDLRFSLSQAALNQSCLRTAPALIVVCADYSITTSRYGQRGRRYVEIEVGGVGQNIYLQAQSLGLGSVAVGAFSDNAVKKVLAIKEEPLYIMPLGRPNE